MTEKEIIEGNKIIDTFMEGDPIYTDKGYLNICKYHTSWDWLMLVVGKIENTKFNGFYNDFVIRTKGCVIDVYGKRKMFAGDYKKGTKILCVWQAIIDYINWYNSLKK